MVKARMITKINNYNPPDDYINYADLTSAKRYLGDWDGNDYIECKHSIDNNIGRVVIPLTSNHYTVISIVDDGTHYIGIIDTVRKLSASTLEVTYTVDWYTSQMLTLLEQNVGSIIAKRLMYRRVYNGEFNYLDDGLKPTTQTYHKESLPVSVRFEFVEGSPLIMTGEFFQARNVAPDIKRISVLLVYHDAPSNKTHWIIYLNELSTLPTTAESMWGDVRLAIGLDLEHNFNPNGVLFYGYTTLNPHILHKLSEPISGQDGILVNKRVITTKSDRPILIDRKVKVGVDWGNKVSTEWKQYRIMDSDGVTVYDMPLGVTLDNSITLDDDSKGLEVSLYANPVQPAITFSFSGDYVGQPSFSVAFLSMNFFADSEQVYKVEDRVYGQEMRKLSTINELVSGVVGGINQGAMISAFSRTQTGVGSSRGGSAQPPLAISKGVIGGGIGIAGAGVNYAYQTLYANKEAQRIEDYRAKVKADTLTMNGYICYSILGNGGLYSISYDNVTIANINAYHSAFGYQTNKIELNRDITELVGYNQADIIFAPGLRTEVERYIKEMLNYGCHFTMVASGGSA